MNWEQFKALLWLRSRLWSNRWRRSSNVSHALSVVFTVLAVIALVAIFVGTISAGWFGLADASPQTHLIVWDVGIGIFLLFWLVGLMTELQRSETIDAAKLMHLPVSLPQLLTLNFAASLVVPNILVLATATIGLTLGLLRSGPQWLILGFPAAGFVFAVAAWTYSLRGWLAVLMSNARRKRSILVALSVSMMLLGQLPNLLMNNPWTRKHLFQNGTGAANGNQLRAEQIRSIHRFIPPAWPAYAASGLAQGDTLPVVPITLCFGVIGTAGLWVAYRQAMRLYGQTVSGTRESPSSVPTRPVASIPVGERKPAFNDRDIPWAPPEAGALALTFLRCHLRAPELRIMFASPLILALAFFTVFSRNLAHPIGRSFLPAALPGAIIMSLIGLTPIFTNQFGFDRHGFRSLILIPTPRRYILLGKNLAALPIAGTIGLLFSAGAAFISGLGVAGFFTAIGLWLIGYIILSIFGNWVSIWMPNRINPGGLQKGRQNGARAFQQLILLPVMMASLSPIMLPVGIYLLLDRTPLAGALAGVSIVVVLTAIAIIYWVTLPAFGEFLEKRERQVLDEVTREIE